MEQFADLKQIVGNAAHKLPHLLIVKKAERKFLIMGENFVPHIIFHFSTHHMAIIGNEKITVKFNDNQNQHDSDQHKNQPDRFAGLPVDHIVCDKADDQGDHQRDRCCKTGKKHICCKQFFIRLIIRKEFFPFSVFHGCPP